MNPELARQAWGIVLTHQKRELLLAVIDHADEAGNAAPGVPYLSWKTEFSDRQIQRLLRDLESEGLLIVLARPYKQPTVYHIDLAAGVTKPAFRPRSKAASGDIQASPQYGDTQMSPHAEAGVTGQENDIVLSGDTQMSPESAWGDTPSANLSSDLSLSQDSIPEYSPIDQQRENAGAHESTPVPFHIANGLGRTRPEQSNALVLAIEAHPVYKAFVCGWDGIIPAIERSYADMTWSAVSILQSDVDAKRMTLQDIENVTRWKLSNPKTQGYRISFVKGDFAGYLAQKRALEKAKQTTGKQSESDGKKYISGPYADFIEH